MPISPFLRSDFQAATAHLKALEASPNPKTFAAYSAGVTAFSALESAFIPVGQTDTLLQEEVRTLLKAVPVSRSPRSCSTPSCVASTRAPANRSPRSGSCSTSSTTSTS